MTQEITLQYGDVAAMVAPSRGSLVTSLRIRGTEMLHLDRDTLEDPARNVRGGIPLLFPFAGSLAGHRVEATGTEIHQHGFGREVPWEVLRRTNGSLRMRMQPDERVRAVWPWPMVVEHTILLVDGGIHQELMVWNQGTEPMPMAPGWHPYFRTPRESKGQIRGNLPGTEPGCVHDRAEVNFGVPPHPDGTAEFSVPGIGIVHLTFAPIMRHVQIWTLPGSNYICLEPFTGPPNFLNHPEVPLVLPGQARTFWARFEMSGALA